MPPPRAGGGVAGLASRIRMIAKCRDRLRWLVSVPGRAPAICRSGGWHAACGGPRRMRRETGGCPRALLVFLMLNTLPAIGLAQSLSCSSAPGARTHCAANTSGGVALAKSNGEAPCLLGKTWGYDDAGIWVADGCSAEFVVGQDAAQQPQQDAAPPEYIPNIGFLLYNGEKGQIYFRLFTYGRYLNQRLLDASYVDSFGVRRAVQQRQDIQLQKFFSPFSGWFLTPKFRYYLYVWSSNPSQGDPAQVVGAGNISYNFNRFVNFGVGITSLPTVRSTEGQFPYWLGVDDRLTSDEFFR